MTARPDPSLPAEDEGVPEHDRPHDAAPHVRDADTSPSQHDKRVGRLPHEHDESTDSQRSAAPTEVGKQAHDDLKSGQQDTDRAPVTDDTYQKQK